MNETITLSDDISARIVGGDIPFPWKGSSRLTESRRDAALKETNVPSLIHFFFPVEQEKSTCQSTEVFLSRWESPFAPRTALGKQLCALRAKAIASGVDLLSEDEIIEEVRRRRGEID